MRRQSGKNDFYRQFIKMGLVKGGAELETMTVDQGKAAIAKLGLASGGACSASYPK